MSNGHLMEVEQRRPLLWRLSTLLMIIFHLSALFSMLLLLIHRMVTLVSEIFRHQEIALKI